MAASAPVPLPPLPLPTVEGYEILGVLGKGGMGVVYRARQRSIDRTVALKLLPEPLARDTGRVTRFLREARALGAINHPNIVAVHDAGHAGATLYFSMELVEGPSLAALLTRSKLPLDLALAICRDVARGLAHAHQAGTVHRDIKPQNIVVSPEGTAKVLDFGLVRLVDPDPADDGQTQLGAILGTRNYMAPEQRANPATATPAADIYSLGLVLAECVTGVRPLDGRLQRWPERCAEVRRLVEAMVSLEPQRRPVGVEIAAALDRIVASPSVRLRGSGRGQIVALILLAALLAQLLPASTQFASRLFWDLGFCLSTSSEGLHPDLILIDTGQPGLARDELAQVLRRLHKMQARTIVLDVLLDGAATGEPSADARSDESLRDAIASCGNVVLVCSRAHAGSPEPREPLESLAHAAHAIGFGNFLVDADGTVRMARLVDDVSGHSHAALAVESVRAFRAHAPTGEVTASPRDAQPLTIPIPYRLAALNFAGLGSVDASLATQVLPLKALSAAESRASSQSLQGKIVLVGCLDSELALGRDLFQTPYHRLGLPSVSGVWLHALLIGALLRGEGPQAAGGGTALLLCLVGVWVPLAAALRGHGWKTIVAVASAGTFVASSASVLVSATGSRIVEPVPFIRGELALIALLVVLGWHRRRPVSIASLRLILGRTSSREGDDPRQEHSSSIGSAVTKTPAS